MIKMVEKNSILLGYYREGKCISLISRELGLSRKTIRNYIKEHEKVIRSKDLINHLEKGLLLKPHYDISKREREESLQQK